MSFLFINARMIMMMMMTTMMMMPPALTGQGDRVPEVPQVPRDLLRDAVGEGVPPGLRRALLYQLQQGKPDTITSNVYKIIKNSVRSFNFKLSSPEANVIKRRFFQFLKCSCKFFTLVYIKVYTSIS